MKKYIFLLLGIFLCFSCSISVNSKSKNLKPISGNSRTESVEYDFGNEDELTAYANSMNAIMFVSDKFFMLNAEIIQGWGDFWYSAGIDDEGQIEWNHLKKHFEIKPDGYIGSYPYPNDTSKEILLIRGFKGVHNNKADLKFRSVHNDVNSLIGCYGDISNLLASDAEDKENIELADGAFAGLFENADWLVHAPTLNLKTLSPECYAYMFKGCTSLKEAPALPAITLAESCYNAMFMGCTNLIQPPELPATNLDSLCYAYMFSGCTSLESVPALPATSLYQGCYMSMFENCKSLDKVDENLLPATNLGHYCYYSMFSDSGISTPIKINVESVINGSKSCMDFMFNNCTNLEYILLPNISDAVELNAFFICKRMFKGTLNIMNSKSISSQYCDYGKIVELYKVSGLPDFYHIYDDETGVEGYYDIFSNNNPMVLNLTSRDANGNLYFYTDRKIEIKGYSEPVVISAFDTMTSLSSKKPFSISSPSGKTWDGSLKYFNGEGFVEWSGSTLRAYMDPVDSSSYSLYFVGDNTVISNGKSWKIEGDFEEGEGVDLTLRLGALLNHSVLKDYDGDGINEISVAENCFNSWFKDDNCIKSVDIKNDPTSMVVLGTKCFYSTFENASKLTEFKIDLNTNVKSVWDNVLLLKDKMNKNPSEYCFSRMFMNCANLETVNAKKSGGSNYCDVDFTMYTPFIGKGWFASMFEGCKKIKFCADILYPENCIPASGAFYRMYYNCAKLSFIMPIRTMKISESALYGTYYNTAIVANDYMQIAREQEIFDTKDLPSYTSGGNYYRDRVVLPIVWDNQGEFSRKATFGDDGHLGEFKSEPFVPFYIYSSSQTLNISSILNQDSSISERLVKAKNFEIWPKTHYIDFPLIWGTMVPDIEDYKQKYKNGTLEFDTNPTWEIVNIDVKWDENNNPIESYDFLKITYTYKTPKPWQVMREAEYDKKGNLIRGEAKVRQLGWADYYARDAYYLDTYYNDLPKNLQKGRYTSVFFRDLIMDYDYSGPERKRR